MKTTNNNDIPLGCGVTAFVMLLVILVVGGYYCVKYERPIIRRGIEKYGVYMPAKDVLKLEALEKLKGENDQ